MVVWTTWIFVKSQVPSPKEILHAGPGFFVCIKRTFIFEDKVLMICKGEKTLEWVKHVVEAIVLSVVGH